MHLHLRLALAIVIGIAVGAICTSYQATNNRQAGDLTWALRAAQDLIAGRDPYDAPYGPNAVQYPLTAALFALPLRNLSRPLAAGIFLGLSSALLTWAITHDGTYWRLLIFATQPFWYAVQIVQWSPLLLALWWLPALAPLGLAKPQLGLPLIVTHPARRRLLECVVVGLFSLMVFPLWPIRWLSQIGTYGGTIPLLLLPLGPLLLVAALRIGRDERVRLLFLMSLMPQRLFYDQLALSAALQTPRQLAIFIAISWLTYAGWYVWPTAGLWLLVPYFSVAVMLLWPNTSPHHIGS